ncbi:hypothetical protein EV189_1077 [Motilibacter rhizosphaerae]|uniref:BNR repeat protein n=1 Tax=Motilibacter rhizosphaerae TaxID=598652 RepID=A0A4Q7NX45_9ACTN|nr:sialidase family protein [Motilibacter rhizosphaerae]RZS91825.1 hypothetical protein EV189_1077 [Motilibacter rhizosphaerae]
MALLRVHPARRLLPRAAVAAAALATLAVPGTAWAAAPGPLSLTTASQVAEQDVPALPGSEPDTLVEPDVAVSPVDPQVAVAVAHDGRYPDGGAVGISYAWTADGGRHWEHHPLPGITATTGGPAVWERASDPVVAFDSDGTVYVSVLVFDSGCDSGVLVSRSTDGGRTFGAPVTAHQSSTCAVSDDKNWLVVDTSPTSPHRGRIYQFWSEFISDSDFNVINVPQDLVWSDDHGATWSAPVATTPDPSFTQDSQPMLRPDGTIVDAYLDYGSADAMDEGSEAQEARESSADRVAAAAAPAAVQEGGPDLVTRISRDGGSTWSAGETVETNVGQGPDGIRCCLPSGTADPVTGRLYLAWNGSDTSQVLVSHSADGVHWSRPRQANPVDESQQAVNVDVAAYGGIVAVSYGETDGTHVQQYVVNSHSGETFSAPLAVGPVSDLTYAAQAGGAFPGDYIGTALRNGVLYAVWCVSSTPPATGATYHQVEYGATFAVSRR